MTKNLPYICKECGQPCDRQIVDFGIGPYEYWGQKGVDVQKAYCSTCCEAEYLNDEGEICEDEIEDPRENKWEDDRDWENIRSVSVDPYDLC